LYIDSTTGSERTMCVERNSFTANNQTLRSCQSTYFAHCVECRPYQLLFKHNMNDGFFLSSG